MMNENSNTPKVSTWQMLVAVVVGILLVDFLPIHGELFRWVMTAIITVVVFVVCVMISNRP